MNESIVNGVLALAPNTTNNLIKQYYDSKIVNSSKFSICIGKDNGYMTIGEYDRSNHLENQDFINNKALLISNKNNDISDHKYSFEESIIKN